MNLRDIQDELSTAYQLDLEQGVAWMNEEYAAKWQKQNPLIWAAIMKIMDLDESERIRIVMNASSHLTLLIIDADLVYQHDGVFLVVGHQRTQDG